MSETEKIETSEDGETATYRGYRLPGPKFFKPEDLVAGINYRPLDGDIILCGYPKTGNTWTSYIMWMILNRNEPYPSMEKLTKVLVPFMEIAGIEPVKALKSPRFYKNHFHYELMKINDKAKYVYTYRKPEDVIVSFYHFRKKPDSDETFDDFFEKFISAEVPYGDYFEHASDYYTHKDEDHLLMVSYEALKANPREEILRLAKFLGEEYFDYLKENDAAMETILEKTSFDYMKSNVNKNMNMTTPTGRVMMSMFRKGVVGDGKQTLSGEQYKKLYEVMRRKLEGSGLLKEWED